MDKFTVGTNLSDLLPDEMPGMFEFVFYEFLRGQASQEEFIDAMKVADKIVAKCAECPHCGKKKEK